MTDETGKLDKLLDAYAVAVRKDYADPIDKDRSDEARRAIADELQQLRAEREGNAELRRFYSVETTTDLIAAMSRHIEKLQSKLPPTRDEQHRTPREG